MSAGVFWSFMRVAAASAAMAATIHAAEAVEGAPASVAQSPTVYSGQPDAAAAPMLGKARASGKIRVIVGLGVTLRQGLAADAAAAQGRALDAAQSGVALRALGSATGEGVVKFDTIPFVSLTVSADQLAKLLKDPAVTSVQEDVPVPPTLAQSVPLINGDDVVAKGITGAGRVVAVLDTGVQSNHPMLAGKVVSEACYSTTNPSSGSTSLCPGGASESTATGSGLPCPSNVDGCFHGTHVASIAAGRSPSLVGVAQGASVVAIQVFSRFASSTYCGSAPACALSYTTDQVKALERVLALKSSLKIDSVNMSLGGGLYSTYCDSNNPAETTVINNLRAAGVATAIASGNDGRTGYISSPACITSAIRVGATTKADGIASYSNHSQLVDLLAPGSSITAALPVSSYGALSGTSMATPHVAGSFALLREAKPDASVADILAALSCTGKQIAAREAGSVTYSKPRIDLLAALSVLKKTEKSDSWTFKKAKDAKDWPAVLGDWKVDDGAYVGKGKSWIATATVDCGPSVKITATLGRDMKDTTELYGNTGVIYKATVSASGSFNGYYAAYNACPTASNGYCSGVKGDRPGQAILYRFTNAQFTNGLGYVTPICVASAAVKVGKLNVIDIVSTPSQQTFKLNGKTVCSVVDASSTAGGVGVVSYNASGKAKGLIFDDLSLKVSKADAAGVEEAQADAGADAVPAPANAPQLPLAAAQGASPGAAWTAAR